MRPKFVLALSLLGWHIPPTGLPGCATRSGRVFEPRRAAVSIETMANDASDWPTQLTACCVDEGLEPFGKAPLQAAEFQTSPSWCDQLDG